MSSIEMMKAFGYAMVMLGQEEMAERGDSEHPVTDKAVALLGACLLRTAMFDTELAAEKE